MTFEEAFEAYVLISSALAVEATAAIAAATANLARDM
jgi:hypothetical protein